MTLKYMFLSYNPFLVHNFDFGSSVSLSYNLVSKFKFYDVQIVKYNVHSPVLYTYV